MANNARAVIDLVANTKQFNSRTDRVLGKLKILQGRMEGVSRAARRMLIVGAAAATGMIFAFAKFEQQMARVLALTGATEKEFAQLNKTARVLGKTTVFSATQAAEAMAAFALQGFKTNEIMAAMKPTLDLAAAGQLGMGQAAAIASGVMKGMKLTTDDLVAVIDTLAKAATSSATDIPLLGESMRAIGPVAKAAGVSLNQTVAIIQAMSDVQIKGAAAGTALRNILIRLQSGAGETQKALDVLGVSIKDNTTGAMKPFATIVDEVNLALKRFDPITRNAITVQIAGIRASAAFTEVMSLGGDVIRKYTKALEDAGGTAKKIADIQIKTLSGSFKLLTSAINETLIAFGSELAPAIDTATKLFTVLTGKINDLDESTKKLVVTLGTLSFAFVGVTAIAAPLLKLLGGTVKALRAIGTAAKWAGGILGIKLAMPMLKTISVTKSTSTALKSLGRWAIAASVSIGKKLFSALRLVARPLLSLGKFLGGVTSALIAAPIAIALGVKAWADYRIELFHVRQELDATTSAIQSAIPAFKQLAEARDELASAKDLKEREAATRSLIAAEKLLIDQIRAEAEQTGAAASDEQRKTLVANAELRIKAIQRTIDAQKAAIVEEIAAAKEAADEIAAIDNQRLKDLEKRTVAANKKADKSIRELIHSVQVLKGETFETSLEFDKLAEAGTGADRISSLLRLMSEEFNLQIEQEFAEWEKGRAELFEQRRKDEAEAIRRSVMTKDAINAEKRERIDLLEQEGRLTAEIADKAREALKIETERASIMGRLEGLTALRSRIAQSAGGRIAPSSQTSVQKTTNVATKAIADATGLTAKTIQKVSDSLGDIFKVLQDAKDKLPFVGVFR